MGWLERWDKRNQRIADELMRNPNAGLEDGRPGFFYLAPGTPLPVAVVATLVGLLLLLWRRRRSGP